MALSDTWLVHGQTIYSPMSSSTLLALLLLLVLASPLLAIDDKDLLDPANGWIEPHEDIPAFNVATAAARDFHYFLWLTDRTPFFYRMVHPDQAAGGEAKPCAFQVFKLKAADHGDAIALALKADTLELVAFANGRRGWHAFKNWRHLFPEATVLSFGGGYDSLVDGGYAGVTDLFISRDSIRQAITEVDEHEQDPGMEEYYIKRALATLSVAVVEAKRFAGIREAVLGAWEGGARIGERQAKYLANWGRISRALAVTEKEGAWGNDDDARYLKDRGIVTSMLEAMDMVQVLMLSPAKEMCPLLP